MLGMSDRAVYKRRDALEAQGVSLSTGETGPKWAYRRTVEIPMQSGVALVFSDTHFGFQRTPTPAWRGLVKLAAAMQPAALLHLGDVIDGAKISRHGRIGWARPPSVPEEIAEAQTRMAELRAAAPKAKRARTVGNHDMRFDNWLSANADAFEGLGGFRLSDHLPDWPECWSIRLGGAVFKHRLRGGIHAVHNNLQAAQAPIFTGHLHRLDVRRTRGYGPIVWGGEAGTMAEHPQDEPAEGGGAFEYLEDGPTNWASGFLVLTWHKGALLRPEVAEVFNGHLFFRGARVS